MRPLLALFAVAGVATAALAQGTVSFNNYSAFTTPGDRLICNVGGTLLVGTDFVAQLYYGPTPGNLRPVSNQPARFRVTTTSSPGTWSGGTRTLSGFVAGDTAWLEVRVWNYTLFPDYDSAAAGGGVRWRSCPFPYTVPLPGSPPGAFFMENFRRGNGCLDWGYGTVFPCVRTGNSLVVTFLAPYGADLWQCTNLTTPAWEPVSDPEADGSLKTPMTNGMMFFKVLLRGPLGQP